MLTAIRLGDFEAFSEAQTLPIRLLTSILGLNFLRKARDSAHKAGDSAHKAGDSAQCPLLVPGSSEWMELENLARMVASKQRVRPELVTEAILRLCQSRYVTLEQLARLLDRNPTALRFRFVKALIKDGVLRYRFPDSPNRPDQAYTAAGSSEQKV